MKFVVRQKIVSDGALHGVTVMDLNSKCEFDMGLDLFKLLVIKNAITGYSMQNGGLVGLDINNYGSNPFWTSSDKLVNSLEALVQAISKSEDSKLNFCIKVPNTPSDYMLLNSDIDMSKFKSITDKSSKIDLLLISDRDIECHLEDAVVVTKNENEYLQIAETMNSTELYNIILSLKNLGTSISLMDYLALK